MTRILFAAALVLSVSSFASAQSPYLPPPDLWQAPRFELPVYRPTPTYPITGSSLDLTTGVIGTTFGTNHMTITNFSNGRICTSSVVGTSVLTNCF